MRYHRSGRFAAAALVTLVAVGTIGCGSNDIYRAKSLAAKEAGSLMEIAGEKLGIDLSDKAAMLSAALGVPEIPEEAEAAAIQEAAAVSEAAAIQEAPPAAETLSTEETAPAEKTAALKEAAEPAAEASEAAEPAAEIAEPAADTDEPAESAEPAAEISEHAEPAAEASESTKAPVSLPAEGDQIAGFRVTSVTRYETGNAAIVTLAHEKSGATLCYIASDGEDPAVSFYYLTPAIDDSGTPFALNSVIREKIAYAENMEGIEFDSRETELLSGYTFRSDSEEKLLRAAESFAASLENLFSDEEAPYLFDTAVSRYSLLNPDSEIAIYGHAYEEALSAETDIDIFAKRKAYSLMYPDSIMGESCFGDSDGILSLNPGDLKEYFDLYYHPSNMLAVLSGDIDLSDFLSGFSENYLDGFEALSPETEDPGYIPWEGYRKATLSFSVSADWDYLDGSRVLYLIALPDISSYELELMEEAASVFSNGMSSVSAAVHENFPDSEFDCFTERGLTEAVLVFKLSNCGTEAASKFREVIDAALSETVSSGLDEDLFSVGSDRTLLELMLESGEEMGFRIAESFAADREPLGFLEKARAAEALASSKGISELGKLISDLTIDPDRSVLLEIDPEPGLSETVLEKKQADLCAMKESMSREELSSLIGDSYEYLALQHFHALSAASEDPESEDTEGPLPDADSVVADEPLSPKTADEPGTEAETETGNDAMETIEGAGYLESDIYLDASALDFDEIHDFVFLTELLGNLPTESESIDELSYSIYQSAYELSFAPTVRYDFSTGEYGAFLGIHSLSLQKNIAKTYEIIGEILDTTDFSDISLLKTVAKKSAQNLRTFLEEEAYPEELAALTASGIDISYEYYAFYDEYLDYLEDISIMSRKNLERLGLRLQKVLEKLRNKNGITFEARGSIETIEEGMAELQKMTEGYSDEEQFPADYSRELELVELPDFIAAAD